MRTRGGHAEHLLGPPPAPAAGGETTKRPKQGKKGNRAHAPSPLLELRSACHVGTRARGRERDPAWRGRFHSARVYHSHPWAPAEAPLGTGRGSAHLLSTY